MIKCIPSSSLIAAIVMLLIPLTALSQDYVLIGWNDLGMHCANKNFSKIAVLPPFNNVNAQLIMKSAGQPPQLVTSGYTIEYSIPNNTYSVGKTDFWTYAQQLFGLPAPLPPNIGLTGKGLTGQLDSSGNYFSARGIPLTPYPDSDLVNENPYQLIHLVAKSKADGSVLATTDAVIPVSNEVGCVQSGCHSSENDILNAHEDVSGFNRNGPVLCANCHSSNALGTKGIPEAGPFSERIHGAHSDVLGSSNTVATCYKCHPGPKTQCLRDIMGRNPTNPLACEYCHGTLANVASSISNGRQPWLQEPQCGNCHGANYAEEPGKLFRQSQGHGGLFCSACHSSPHSILPTVQPNDNLQNIRLQGFAGTLRKCSVCHATPPSGPGPHGIMDTVYSLTHAPVPTLPSNGVFGITTNPRLQWTAVQYDQTYRLQVAADSSFSTVILDDSSLTTNYQDVGPLGSGNKYYWRVLAVNSSGSTPWSDSWSFTTGTGTTYTYTMNSPWNLVSLPVDVSNPQVAVQFPSANSAAYGYIPNSGYVTRDTLIHGAGYWMKFNNTQPLNMTGMPYPIDTINVAAGWNLIGSVSNPVAKNSIITMGTTIGSQFFGYNKGYLPSDTLLPAHGYWVKVSDAGKLILGAGAMNMTATNASALLNMNSLIAEDASGNKQTLYFGKSPEGAFKTNQYEMPPAAPEGEFDVRYGTDTYVEFAAIDRARELPVIITTNSYPVTVKWRMRTSPFDAVFVLNGTELSAGSDGMITLADAQSRLVLKLGASAARNTPQEFVLEQNYPNPFNPTTVINYQLPFESRVVMKVYNIVGEVVSTLVDGVQGAGMKSVEWNSGNYSSGIYFYRIQITSMESPTKTFTQGRKMLLLK
ncbi:MAG: T9SS type A sorting domain-containing protein [Bacteroidota bacterium]